MKWNIEWVDLKNIERMAAECWRMSERQLVQYCRDLSEKQDLVFAGEIGRAFFLMLCESLDKNLAIDWSKLQKDVRFILDLIHDGQGEDEQYWISRYKELSENASSYFYTRFGRSFITHLADKMELNISESQRLLRRDIYTIQGICDTCNWENEAEVQKAIAILKKKEKSSFSSWLGEGFVELLQEKYEKKETIADEIQAELEQELRTKHSSSHSKKHKWPLKRKLLCVLAACVSTGGIAAWLYVQTQNAQGITSVSDMMAIFGQLTSDSTDSQTTDSAAGSKNEDGMGKRQNELERIQESSTTDGSDPQGTQENSASDGSDPQEIQENSPLDEGIQENSTSDSSKNNYALGQSDDTHNEAGDALIEGQGAAEQTENDQKGSTDQTAGTGQEDQSEDEAKPEILSQYQSFYNKYPDLFGWLKIAGTEIDHPVMQSDDKKRGERYYYLHRDYTGKRAEEGSLFVESKSSCYPQDDNTVIYGHNMSNGHNFGILEEYKDKDFYKNHQTIQYDTIYETGTYQIAAVFISRVLYQEEEGFRYYHFYNYSSKNEYQECVDFINENKLYDTGVKLQYGDQLLMLSTCEYSRENGRLVVVAKRVESN